MTSLARSSLQSLTRREIVRITRQPARVIAGLGTVAMLWLVFASGLAGAFSHAQQGYGAFLVPAMASMVVLFASIFGAISLIEDRQEGFLQGVLVSPAPLWSVMGAKVLGGSAIALAQGVAVLALAPLTAVSPTPTGWLLAVLALAAMCMGITGLALAIAWKVRSVAGFHGVMNLVLMPMWLLGGTLFPIDSASPWLATIMRLDPMAWTIDALRQAMTGSGAMGIWAWIGSAGFAVAALAAACIVGIHTRISS